LTAKVDGQAWTAAAGTIIAREDVAPAEPGTFTIRGQMTVGLSDAIVIQLVLFNIGGPGTYPLGVNSTTFGGLASVGRLATSWVTPGTGAAGTVTITTLTATRIAGTFSFTARKAYGSGAASTAVTDGQFDLTLDSGGSLEPIPDNHGSRVACSMGGSAWNAATVVATNTAANLAIGATNEDYSLTIILQAVPGPGDYVLSETDFSRLVSIAPGVGGTPNPNCCWTIGPGITGTVHVTSITATRATGTFEVTLPPQGGTSATTPVSITAGEFNVGFFL
jgi:hypothetical protein